MKRRNFLKLTSVAGTLAMFGCGRESVNTLIPFLNPPEDIIPGIATWYATTCRQCPAGCGIFAKNREARVIKFEGNPHHPINAGRLCMRGQAGLQELYSPDRLKAPTKRTGGTGQRISWKQALAELHGQAAQSDGKVAVVSGIENGYASDNLNRWLARYGGTRFEYFEAINYEAIKKGNEIVFGRGQIPSIDISGCDLIVSVSAEFLETWISPVQLTAQYTKARDLTGTNARFIYAGPRQSLTGASADKWIPIRAGGEADLLFALLKELIGKKAKIKDSAYLERAIKAVNGHSTDVLASRAGTSHATAIQLGSLIAEAENPLILADGSAEAVVAANFINSLTGAAGKCFDFTKPMALTKASTNDDVRDLTDRCLAGEINTLLIHKCNPAYFMPDFAKAMAKVPHVVALDTEKTETTELASLALPLHSSYESWGWYKPVSGLVSFIQPAMGPVFNSKPLEAVLAGPSKPLGANEAHQLFIKAAISVATPSGSGSSASIRELQSKGFLMEPDQGELFSPVVQADQSYTYKPDTSPMPLRLFAYPNVRLHDGRHANRSWMMEIPDPITMITWDSWIEISPATAAKLGLEDGSLAEVQTSRGSARVGVHVYPGVHDEVAAIPMGLGHRNAGVFADGFGVNAVELTGMEFTADVKISATGEKIRPANTDGSRYQHGRNIVRVEYETEPHDKHDDHHGAHHEFPVRLPIPEEHDPKLDIYPPIQYEGGYRWGMVIDLDKCTACSACVAACYAENNIATVGKERIIEGRELSWIHIERYYEDGDSTRLRFIPMLCQHCENAPCESVCPVYAPHHNHEGLNTQIYNRCVGTRYCSQNCVYKVRRFNFYRYPRPKPLNMQLNPDVTVRSIGVMEKCSFCVQRIKDAHQSAKIENRPINDGEIQPACLQTCPANAIVFGNLLDPNSGIRKLLQEKRDHGYQVLDELNTKPGVIYLKRKIRDPKIHEV